MSDLSDTPLKIVFFSPFQLRLRRGIERATHNMALNLALLKQDVTLICRSGELPTDQHLVKNGIKYCIVPYVRYFESLFLIPFYVNNLLKIKPDVVIVYFAGYGEAPSVKIARLFFSITIVFYVGYPIDLVPHRFNEFKQTGFDRYLDSIVVKADHMVPAIERFFGKPVYTIPNGVDTNYFQPQNTRAAQQESIYRLITVAALEKRKGFDCVLSALPEIMKQIGTVQYTIVGEGPDREWLQKCIEDLNLESFVRITGQVDDVRPYLAEADIFVLPSYGEGLPNAFLEASAMGLPSVLSDDPPYDSIAKPDFSILVKRSDKLSMVKAIVSLLSDQEKRISMGKAARYYMEQTYSWSSIAIRYLDVLRVAHNAKN